MSRRFIHTHYIYILHSVGEYHYEVQTIYISICYYSLVFNYYKHDITGL